MSTDNFSHREKSWPSTFQTFIEKNKDMCNVIWVSNDMLQYKQLLPVIKQYPDNPVLVTDDDIIRDRRWVETFYNDHIIYPDDVIVGAVFDTLNSRLNYIDRRKSGHNIRQPMTPGMIFNFSKYQAGIGGALFPPHTFTDPRFFDEKMIIHTCYKDASLWYWTFNILEGKQIRLSSMIFSINLIKETQEETLYSRNDNEYNEYFNNIKNSLPEVSDLLHKRQNKILVSFNFNRAYINNIKVCVNSILRQTKHIEKKCITIYRNDYGLLPNDILQIFENNNIEVIIADEDLSEYNAYYYPMLKYPDYAVIIVKCNIVYNSNVINNIYNNYLRYPYAVIAQRCSVIHFVNKKVILYNAWSFDYPNSLQPLYNIVADPVAAVLYPPNSLGINRDFTKVIRSFIGYEELYMKYIENIRNIPVYCTGDNNDFNYIDDPNLNKYKLSLYKDRCQQYYDMYGILNNTNIESSYNTYKDYNSEFNNMIQLKRKM